MTRDLDTCPPSAAVQEVARPMETHRVRRIPVVEAGRVVGIVSLGDLATKGTPGGRIDEPSRASDTIEPAV